MRNGASPSCYLVEWYTPDLADRSIVDVVRRLEDSSTTMPADFARPQLMYAVEVSEDCYSFAMFAAESAELVHRACEQAGLPAGRVTAAREARPDTSGGGDSG